MKVATLIEYLCGRRGAILKVASSPGAVWVGLLFVLSAGLAREYDGEDLLHEPWHLVIPLGASLATSLLLYAMLRLVLIARKETVPVFLGGYRGFLGLYWFTAPLAWLYGIPVERFLSVSDAVAANLWLLGIVSLWRVLLMSRVVSVLFGWRFWAAFVVVMLFADLVAMGVLWLTPLPVFHFMGGIRLTEGEQIIQSTAFIVRFLGAITLPLWLIGTATVASSSQARASRSSLPANNPQHPSLSLWFLASVGILAWLAFLPWTQPEQQNRRRVERLMRACEIAVALEFMFSKARSDFPRHWDPPPRIGYGERVPSLAAIFDVIATNGASGWVVSLYVEKAVFHSDRRAFWNDPPLAIAAMDDDQLSRLLDLLESLSAQGMELAATLRRQLEDAAWPRADNRPPIPVPGTRRRELLDRLLALAHRHDGGPASLDELLAKETNP